jgi:rfaE bifunctional protein nucleotidyltransferase chain/domain/rfaE bifunctional protein kinase chain/domain
VQECHLVAVHLLAMAVDQALVEEACEPTEPVEPQRARAVTAPRATAAVDARTSTAKRPRIVVVGDALLDRDSAGSVRRLSPEAPVPVVSDIDVVTRPGGAGLAAVLTALDGNEVILVTALARDAAGDSLRGLLDASGVRIVDLGLAGPTPLKTRIRAADRTLLMLDEAGVAGVVGSEALHEAVDALSAADGILVSDYGRGVTAVAKLREVLCGLSSSLPVVWDPHPHGTAPVPGIRLATPNSREAATLAGGGAAGGGLGADIAAARVLLDRWQAAQIAVTRGSRGAILVQDPVGAPLVVNGREHAAMDSCGAGDRFAVAVTTLLAKGALISEAVTHGVELASAYVAAGGPRCVERGMAVTSKSDHDRLDPIALAQRVRAAGGTVVAAGGCFDLLHTGHVRMLEEARRLGDCLIVCMNADESVARLKGPARPVLPAVDREAMLRSLRSVDAVVVFHEDTPERVLRMLQPDIFVKGGDYSMAELPEMAVLRGWGGQVVAVPYVAGYSSTSLIRELARARR